MKVIAFDWGHTLMDERRTTAAALAEGVVHLMPDVLDVLPRLSVPLAVWTNTRTGREADVREWFELAGIEQWFTWIATSVDAGARKPRPAFFEFALRQCGLAKEDVLFVGNQLNTDVRGGEAFGIRTVWLSGAAYRSEDDDRAEAGRPTYEIERLRDLPALVERIRRRPVV